MLSFLVKVSVFLILFSSAFFAQTDSAYIKAEEVLEDILIEPNEDRDNSNSYEFIEQLLLNPIEINSSSISEMQQIPGLDAGSASLIYNHRIKYGDFFSVDELNAVRGLDNKIINQIKPFLTVNNKLRDKPTEEEEAGLLNNILSNSKIMLRSRFSKDLQLRKGFTNNRFQGSSYKTYNRLLINYEKTLRMGLLIEKDPGEIGINEFSSYHLFVTKLGLINQAVVGDYLIESGQGLVFWSPYGFSKGADAIYPVKKRANKIRPYTSATENNFLRGIAGSVNIYDFTLTAFYSKNKFDARIDSISGNIISIPVDGFHRTESELSRKRTAEETIFGSNLDFNYGGLNAGILYSRSTFSNNLLPSDIFDLEGNEFNYTSAYYDLRFGNINLYGEFAYNGISVASINSFSFYIGRDLSFVTSVRNYPRNYVSLHGYAFGEQSGSTSNEVGIYTGIKWQTPLGILNFYYDQFKFPFATFSNPRPGSGEEFLAELVNKLFRKFEAKFRYKYEYKDVPKSIEEKKNLVKRLKQLLRLELIYYPVKAIRLKGRIDYNRYRVEVSDEKEDGISLFQDVRYSPNQNLNIYFRIILFKTDSFNSAIYEFENDLTGVLSNRALFGEGVRWYFVLRYKLLRLLTFSLKYSETYKPGVDNISSGLNEINNNVDNRLSLQLDLRF